MKDEMTAYKRLCNEVSEIEPLKSDLYYDIGNGYCRLDLRTVKALGIDLWLVSRIFYLSALDTKVNEEDFYNDVALIRKLCNEGKLPFKEKDIHSFLKKWEDSGKPPFSHSETYRNLYSPSYRVVLKKYADVLLVLDKIIKLSRKRRTVVAIDGRCGSGKTTFAEIIRNVSDCSVVHADDFFLPPKKRTENRLNEAGGNFDYERFQNQVINGIKSNSDFEYEVFSCCEMKINGVRKIKNNNIIVVEGSYCMHPYLEDVYDIRIFSDVSKDIQRERIIRRNGEECYRRFEEKWIPMEEKYFREYNIINKCDMSVELK